MSNSLALPTPQPFELQLDDSGMLRGLLWQGDQLPVLFVHDLRESDDIDCWGALPEIVQRAGHAAIAIDLPGHGLSDGEQSADRARKTVERCCQHLIQAFGPRFFIVAAGSSSGILPSAALAALVLFSPPDENGAEAAYPKLLFVGAADPDARAAADRYLRASRGWTLVSSFATATQGADLLKTDHAPKIAAQLLAFLRDYR